MTSSLITEASERRISPCDAERAYRLIRDAGYEGSRFHFGVHCIATSRADVPPVLLITASVSWPGPGEIASACYEARNGGWLAEFERDLAARRFDRRAEGREPMPSPTRGNPRAWRIL